MLARAGMVLFACAGLFSFEPAAAGVNEDCFKTHLLEAIGLNETRAPLYSAATNGRSLEISNKLIGLEKIFIMGNKLFGFDRRARPYNRAGIPVLCLEMMPMAQAPKYVERRPEPWPRLESFQALDGPVLARELAFALKDNGLRAMADLAEESLNVLLVEPRFHCMSRHVLESLIRTARLAPEHARKALRLGLPSTEKLSRSFAQSHLPMLSSAAELDAAAAPLQAEGIGILCQDVPPIPIPPRVSP